MSCPYSDPSYMLVISECRYVYLRPLVSIHLSANEYVTAALSDIGRACLNLVTLPDPPDPLPPPVSPFPPCSYPLSGGVVVPGTPEDVFPIPGYGG